MLKSCSSNSPSTDELKKRTGDVMSTRPPCPPVRPVRLLLAHPLRIRLRLIDDDPVIQVGHVLGDVLDELVYVRHVGIVDVLRLIRDLVVIGVAAGREEGDRDAVAGVLVVVASAVDVHRVTIRVHAVVESEAVLAFRVHLFDQVA